MYRYQKLFSSMAAVICAMLLIASSASVTAQETGDVLEGISLGELLNIKYIETATKHLMEARKAPAIATVITAEEIRNMGARDLTDILRRIPGLEVPVYHSARLKVRGIHTTRSEKVLLLLDGHKMNNHFDGSAMYTCDNLMVKNIKRVEFVKGPGSALYGTNAFTGVINVITKTAKDIDGQEISVSGGSFATQHYVGLFSHAGSNFEISGHGDYLDTDGPDHFIEKDALTGKTGSLAPGNTLEFIKKWDVGLNMRYGDFHFVTRAIYNERGPYIGAGQALNDESVRKMTQVFGDLTYNKRFTDDLDMAVRLYSDYYKSDVLWELFPEGFTGEDDKGLLGSPLFKNKAFGGEITGNCVSGDHLITAGAMYETVEQYDVRSLNNFADPFADMAELPETQNFNKEISRDIYAVYLQNMWEMTAYDSLILGVRYDHYDDFGGTVNPRAGYVHEFRNGLIMKLLYGSAFRAPNFLELYTINNPVVIGNPQVKPEKIGTYEAALEYPFLKYYTLNISCFHDDIEDLIKSGPKPESGPAEYINIDGKTRINGFETGLEFNFGKGRYGHVSCSYQEAKDETIPDAAQWLANAEYNHPLTRYLNANINVSWVGKRPRSEGNPRDDVDSYTLVNLTLIAKEFWKGIEISGSVYNLFDEDCREPSADLRVPNDYPINKRMFMAEITYKF